MGISVWRSIRWRRGTKINMKRKKVTEIDNEEDKGIKKEGQESVRQTRTALTMEERKEQRNIRWRRKSEY